MTETSNTLFKKIGQENLFRVDELHKQKKILAVHHQSDGTHLVLDDTSTLLLDGLSEDDSRKVVGYLGFYGHGPYGLDSPAFAVNPDDNK